MSNNQKPVAENQKEPVVLFRAEMVDRDNQKSIAFVYKTQHIPTLDCIVQQLSYDIIELRAVEKAKQEKAKLKILTSGPVMSLNQLLNRKRK